ncbi:hypothetical protein TVAG_238260 [Trichomonas vaginalis G3]|uniref:DUF3447 domain-containing protein n=1 Tax=Trichomonas vaginalis (strain ATCC PRA-98 / G3) TaxID=412133 RepID=A2DD26_TRIV3|nr:spectrin binding [Trichomonas vaginalis G3]EAY21800.1 hypothetical protein TVAG_238260 [Trichomonas vaginalis G3]KAI5524244.1 spectrin binding [Trichomonas vaginalis G3]|eukprot:XP_001582786.1 hypothetical protein [Trichomonas vaginalis G3]
MSEQDLHQIEYNELRSRCKYYIDIYNVLYQLKTENEEELKSIYKMIKTELIDSKNYLPQNIIKDILDIIPYNNRYTKSYLYLAKFVYDDYNVIYVNNVEPISKFLFYKEFGIRLDKSGDFINIHYEDRDIFTKNTIYRAIMDDDKERFIYFIESEEFYEDQQLYSNFSHKLIKDIHCLNYVVTTEQLIVSSY